MVHSAIQMEDLLMIHQRISSIWIAEWTIIYCCWFGFKKNLYVDYRVLYIATCASNFIYNILIIWEVYCGQSCLRLATMQWSLFFSICSLKTSDSNIIIINVDFGDVVDLVYYISKCILGWVISKRICHVATIKSIKMLLQIFVQVF